MSTFLSYTLEKKTFQKPGFFWKGAIEGVAGPETANNAGAGGGIRSSAWPLGIPLSPIMGKNLLKEH